MSDDSGSGPEPAEEKEEEKAAEAADQTEQPAPEQAADQVPKSLIFPGMRQVHFEEGVAVDKDPTPADPPPLQSGTDDSWTEDETVKVPILAGSPPDREPTTKLVSRDDQDQASAGAREPDEAALGSEETPPSGQAALGSEETPPLGSDVIDPVEAERVDEAEAETGLSGREQTLLGDTDDSAPVEQDEALSGREQTLLGDSDPGTTTDIDTSLSGREQTLLGDSDPGTTTDIDTNLSGREQTLLGDGDTGPTPTPLSGREQTMVGDTGPTPTPLSGREQTMVGDDGATPVTAAAGDKSESRTSPTINILGQLGNEATAIGDNTPRTFVPGSSDKPITRAGSSAAFDAGWHLQGRKGPYTGQTWGDFDLGGILGEGGMGAVYRAMQKSLKRRVAIKVLPPNLAQDANLLQRFQLEASIASKLSSPHIVQVYFIGEEEGNHYYAMEYVDGKDLYDIVKEKKEADATMTPNEAANYILQAAKGLAEAGRYGVVHRDIKPPNLMVDNAGLVKIADFGIVKVLGEHQLTMTGQAVGTPAYCSPEQGRGDGEIDQRSDLYSLGVVFYELACGRKPFEATTPNALIYKHCYEEPELPQKVNASISDEYQAIILKLLQKNAEKRYQSADDLVRDLEAIRTGNMLESALANLRGTGADEAKREQMNWLQRNLIPVLMAAGVVVAALGGGGYYWLQQRQAEELQARRATEELRPTIAAALDDAKSLPADIDSLLIEYGKLSPDGDEDTDLQRWQAKVRRVRELQTALEPLDEGADTAAVRQQAVRDLAAYTAEVGTEDGAAQRWTSRLKELDEEEATVRARMRDLMAGLLDQGRRDALGSRAERLTTLAGDTDELVITAHSRATQFDNQVEALTDELAIIDEGKSITEAQRNRLLTALGQFSPLVGDGDARVQRWRVALDEAAGQVDRLRGQLAGAIGTSSALPLTTIDAVSGDLELYAELVAEDDRNLLAWRKQIEVSQKRVENLRKRLEDLKPQLDEERTLPAPVLPGLKTMLADLRKQAGQGDAQALEWTQVHRRSETVLADLRERTLRLGRAQPQPIPVALQQQLATELARLETKDGIDPALAKRYHERLKQEDERVAALRQRLTSLDTAVPFTASLNADLVQLASDIDGGDPDLQRWQAKRERILDLREKLAVLDERRSVPDDLQQLFDQLVEEVSDQAPEVLRWGPKVALIAQLRADLADLLEATSLPADVDGKLQLWVEQVGPDDATYIQFRLKVDRVRELSQALIGLDQILTWPPEAQAQAHDRLAELLGLVGTKDEAVVIAARRIAELDGPAVPAWASDSGRDQFGLWATVGDERLDLRFRYCPPGTFTMGESSTPLLTESDEVPVPVTISRGFWIADAECTQAQWTALAEDNPAYFEGDNRPVERVDIAMIAAWMTALEATHGTAGARLPTEAEWEFACRGGAPLPARDELESLAWYDDNSGATTQAVRGRYANAIGLYDMLGNVAEWTSDGYGSYPTSAATDPSREGGNRRVARGGSWGDEAARIRPANRIAVGRSVESMYLGFRAVVPSRWDTPPDGTALLAKLATERGEHTFSLKLGEARITVSLPLPVPETTPDEQTATPEAPTEETGE